MKRLASIPSSFVQTLLIAWLLIMCSSVFAANSYRQIELRYRNASDLQQSLQPLLSSESAIVAEGNTLILRGPAAELNQLAGIIKKLDRPQRQLEVSIYRGVDPSSFELSSSGNKHQDQRWSTNTGKNNRVDTVVIDEGSTLVISEQILLSVPVSTSDTVLKRGKRLIVDSGQGEVNLHSSHERLDTFVVDKGLTLVATLVKGRNGKTNISLKTTYILPSSENNNSDKQQKITPLSTTSSIVTVVELKQWQLLSSHQLQSHRPSINSSSGKSSQIFSTQKKGEHEYKVWVKFTVQ